MGLGGEIASRERVIDRKSAHQGGLMYLAKTCDAAGGLPGVQLPTPTFWGEISRLRGARSSRIPVPQESASRITVFG